MTLTALDNGKFFNKSHFSADNSIATRQKTIKSHVERKKAVSLNVLHFVIGTLK